MNIRICLTAIVIALYVSGCATAKRGSKQMFMVSTEPAGAKVETTLLVGAVPKFKTQEIEAMKSGAASEPKLVFETCESTPCAFELPRKREFDILVSKEGYVSQVHTIDYFHRKEIARQIKKEVALSTVVVGTGAAALGASAIATGTALTSLGTATASTGAMAAGAALLAAPVAGLALLSVGVDKSTGANYDYWPNPAALTLEEGESVGETTNVDIHQKFDEARRSAVIRSVPSRAQAKYEKEQRAKARALRLKNDRLFKDHVALIGEDPQK